MDKKRSTISSAWLRIKSILIMLGVIYILGCMIMPTERKIRYYQTEEEVEHERFLDSLMRESIDEKEVEVTVTVYNPVTEQCDEDPTTTADGSKIRFDKLYRGDLKWIAISRDLRETFNYGDSVTLSGNPEINGDYVVHDLMNPRFKGRVDILRPAGDIRGKWVGIIIKKK